MILQKSDFYSIISFKATADQVAATLQINPEHTIFEGHFPGRPVVPGVCMLQMVKELAEQALGKKLQLSKVAQAKYLQVLVPEPNQPVMLQIDWKDALSFAATIKRKDEIIMKMSGQFEG